MKLNAFATSCYRIMLNIKCLDKVSNHRVYDLNGISQLSYYGMATFCAWRRMDQLTFYFVSAQPPPLPPPHHGKRLPGRLHKSFSSQLQEWIDPNFFMTSCALPKTKPAGDKFHLTALWLTDDDEIYLDFMEHFSARP